MHLAVRNSQVFFLPTSCAFSPHFHSADYSVDLVQKLIAVPENSDLPRDRTALKLFLSQPLQAPIPTRKVPNILPAEEVVFDPMLSLQYEDLHLKFMNAVKNDLYRDPPSENDMHISIDLLIRSVFRYLDMCSDRPLHLTTSRGVDITHTGSNTLKIDQQPDFMVWIKDGSLVFRGEEEHEDMDKAEYSLRTKLHFNPLYVGGLPYIIGYAAVKDRIRFYMLDA